jgi:hypothetical protein
VPFETTLRSFLNLTASNLIKSIQPFLDKGTGFAISESDGIGAAIGSAEIPRIN